MIAVIDYGMGNVRSLMNAVRYVGYDAFLTRERTRIVDSKKIILPGVGSFGDAMHCLKIYGLNEILYKEIIEKGKPLLGICLGLQLLARSSIEHGYHLGLGWLDAEVVGFEPSTGLKVPHMGWSDICFSDPFPLFEGLKERERHFYFVHSFYMICKNESDVSAICKYGIEFAAAICRGNIVATQFHPEKSQDNGIQVLKNFLAWNP